MPLRLYRVLVDLDEIRKQPRDIRIGADFFRQAGAERGVELARGEQLAERFAGLVVLDRHFLQQRQHGRMAVRAGLVHGALHPADLGEVDAEFVVQDAVDEDGGGHRVERHADAFAFEILGRLDAGLLVDGDEAHAEGDRGEHRDGDERALVAGKSLREFGRRIFGDVEFLAAGHAVENRPRLIDGDEIEIDAVGLHLARIERLHPVVEAARKRKLQLGHGPSVLPCSDCGLRLARRFAEQEGRPMALGAWPQCNSLRRILPILLFGNWSRNSMMRGTL